MDIYAQKPAGPRSFDNRQMQIYCKNKDLMLQLYKSLARVLHSGLETVPKKDINVLERVQRRATRMIAGYSKLNYEERLASLGLTSHWKQEDSGDLIEVFKITT